MSHATIDVSNEQDVADEPWVGTGPWTVDHLNQLPENGQRYEIIDGGLFVSPPPALSHQGIARRITALFNRSVDAEWEALEGVGVVLRNTPEARMIIPDVVVARHSTLWSGATTLQPADVALAAEVVSPSSTTKDRVLKPTLFAEARVPAYWRVEQESAGPTVVLHRLVGDVYKEDDVVRTGQVREITWPVTCRLAPAELTG